MLFIRFPYIGHGTEGGYPENGAPLDSLSLPDYRRLVIENQDAKVGRNANHGGDDIWIHQVWLVVVRQSISLSPM